MTTGKFDILFIFASIASLLMMADDPSDSASLIALSPSVQVIILALVGSLVASFIVFASAIDRKCTEDYLYQIMANAGLVGVATCLLVNMLWLLAMMIWNLPDLTGQNIAGVTLFGWIVGYYWFRYRGTVV